MSDPLRAHPVPDGRPPLPDGREVPQPPRPASQPVTRRQWVSGWVIAAIVVAALVVGVARRIW